MRFSMLPMMMVLIVMLMLTLRANSVSVNNFQLSKGGVNFSVDPRIEVLVVVQYLSGSPRIKAYEPDYVKSIDEWFADYREHPIIRLWPALETNYFAYDLPVSYMLQFDGIPFNNKVNRFPDYLEKMNQQRLKDVFRGKIKEAEFLRELNDFVLQTKFDQFMEANTDLYNEAILSTTATLEGVDVGGTITNWYGLEANSFNFILSPLLGASGYGPCLQNEAGALDVYCVSAPRTSRASLLELMLHEFSHSYINPLVDEFYPEFHKTRKLRKPIAKQMSRMAYNSWWIILVEHYVRGATIRMLLQLEPEYSPENLVRWEAGRGFIYATAVDRDLVQYEQLRQKDGISFRDYMPYLVRSMNDISRLPKNPYDHNGMFNGIIASVYGNNALIIIPHEDADSTVAKFIRPSAEFVVSRTGGRIITDVQALKLKLNKNHLIIYGTPQNNKWLAKHMNIMRFKIEPDKIVADKEYPGRDLRIISVQQNPYNPKLGMLVYASQRPQDMSKSNAVNHGKQEFVVSSSDCNVLGEGFYPR